jgi:glycosyltransferase involved in cell wall biosynthesis
MPFDLTCYHIDDEYSFSAVEVAPSLSEEQLIRDVNQVFIHSPGLLARLGSINPNTAFIPNGVDYDNYATTTPEPYDLSSIPRPRIGYTGWLKKHLDWSLLRGLAMKHPEWSFVFVGPVGPHPEILPIIEELSRRSNVHFLGAKSFQELAVYPQHFDVCIMPYSLADYSAHFIYPLKLHEYLASGTPVVGSRIRSLEEFSNLVTLADTSEGWSTAISASLGKETNSITQRLVRQKTAKEHDWNCLVAKIASTMAAKLGYKIPSKDD